MPMWRSLYLSVCVPFMPVYGNLCICLCPFMPIILKEFAINNVVGNALVIIHNENVYSAGSVTSGEGCVELNMSEHRLRQVYANLFILLALTLIDGHRESYSKRIGNCATPRLL